jgi:hypothetical protein
VRDTLAQGVVARLPRPRMFGAPVIAGSLDRMWLVGATHDASALVPAIRERPQAARAGV